MVRERVREKFICQKWSFPQLRADNKQMKCEDIEVTE